MEILRDLDEYIGKYYSIEYVRKNVLGQSEQDIKEINNQIKKETQEGKIDDGDDEGDNKGEDY